MTGRDAPRPEPRPLFVLTLRPEPGTDGIRGLRAVLKALLRRHRLRCIGLEQRPDAGDAPPPLAPLDAGGSAPR